MDRPSKVCASCGRRFEWRKKWARDWDSVRYCSNACKRARVSALDERLEQTIATLLEARGSGKTICPSEAARAVEPENWRPLMEPTRRAARRMVERGELQITQKGRVVDPTAAKGPIRLRLP
ncbi:MAG: DUF2256 and DUF3253 domain-containing protein [Myxococcota bacterium]